MPGIKKIIWAVDLFSEHKPLERHGLKNISLFTKGLQTTIEPVSVFSAWQLPEPDAQYLQRVFKKDILEGATLRGLKPVKLITTQNLYPSSTNSEVHHLLKYAEKRKADLIVVHSTAQTGFSRLLMGSFAETLINASPIPVFVINAHSKTPPKMTKIFFPSDGTKNCLKVFGEVVRAAKRLKAKVYTFNHVEISGYRLLRKAYPRSAELLEELKQMAHKNISDLESMAQKTGVPIVPLIEISQTKHHEAILRQCKKNGIHLIATTSQKGPLRAGMLGSVTREVVRRAERPVWVLH